jgi:O-antigen/teichoic acid export membrane protein
MRLMMHGLVYLSTSFLNKAIPFLMLPVMTRYLSPAQYGLLSLFVAGNGLVGAFVGMSMHTNIASNFYTGTRQEIGKVVGNVIFALSVTSFVTFALIASASLVLKAGYLIPWGYLLLMPVLAFCSMIATLYTTILRHEGRVFAFAAFEVLQTVLTIAVTLLLLAGFGWGWASQVAAMTATGLIFMAVSWRYMHRNGYLLMQFDRHVLRAILELSLPLIPHAIGGMVIASSDRLFIERMVGIEAVGLYAIGYSFGMSMGLVSDSFARAWGPWVFRALSTGGEQEKMQIVRLSYAAVVGMYLAATAIAWISAAILPYLAAPSYIAAGEFIFWVAMAYATRGAYQVFFPILVHIRKTFFLAFSTMAAACLNIALNLMLIERYGAIGAAYATFAAYSASALLVFWYQHRNFTMPWFRIAA